MEFHINLAQAQPDMDALQEALRGLDPAAVADTDPRSKRLRVATWLGAEDVAWVLRRAGIAVWEQDLIRIPSVCCGGCSG